MVATKEEKWAPLPGSFSDSLLEQMSVCKSKSAFSLHLQTVPLVGLLVDQLLLLCPTVTHSKQIFALCIAELAPRDLFDINSCSSE